MAPDILDPNTLPDSITKARAIVQTARAALTSTAALEDGSMDAALWAVEDLLTDAREACIARDVALATIARGKAMGKFGAEF